MRCKDPTPKGIADCLAEWVGERLVSTVGDYFLTQAEEKYHIQEAMADYHALYPPYNPLPRLTPEQIDALNSRPLPKFEDMLEDIYRGMEANGYDVRNAWASRLLEATMLPSKPLPTASEPAPDAPMDAVLLSADVPPEMIRMAADVEAAANGPETSQPESVQPPVTKETKEEDSGIWSYTKKVGSFLWGFMDGAAERTRPTSDAIHHILMKPERFVVETGKGLLKLANDFTGYVMYYLPGGQVFTEKHRSAVAVSHAVFMGIVDFLKQGQKHFIDLFEAENTEDRGSAVGKITHDTLAIWLMFRSLFSRSVSPGKRAPRPDKATPRQKVPVPNKPIIQRIVEDPPRKGEIKFEKGKHIKKGKEIIATPNEVERSVAQRLARKNYTVEHLVEKSKLGIQGSPTADLKITGLPGTSGPVRVDIYSPTSRSVGTLSKEINEKRLQCSRVLVDCQYGRMTQIQMVDIAREIMQKNLIPVVDGKLAPPLSDLYFLQPDNFLIQFIL